MIPGLVWMTLLTFLLLEEQTESGFWRLICCFRCYPPKKEPLYVFCNFCTQQERSGSALGNFYVSGDNHPYSFLHFSPFALEVRKKRTKKMMKEVDLGNFGTSFG